MHSVVLIDDDPSLLEVLTLAFEDEGYRVAVSTSGVSGLALIVDRVPDVVVCDVNIPDLDGFTICRKLREAGSTVPVLLLTARDDVVDEALGLDLGADDYVTKPFNSRVLLARVAALIRRSAARDATTDEPRIAAGELVLLPERLEVTYGGTAVPVTVSECRLLQCLVERAGRVLSRAHLLEAIRDDGSVVADRIIDTYVRRLRRKLEAVDPAFDRIETVVGAGYRWKAGP
jgi:DNA-binding response OmpR family regulator